MPDDGVIVGHECGGSNAVVSAARTHRRARGVGSAVARVWLPGVLQSGIGNVRAGSEARASDEVLLGAAAVDEVLPGGQPTAAAREAESFVCRSGARPDCEEEH